MKILDIMRRLLSRKVAIGETVNLARAHGRQTIQRPKEFIGSEPAYRTDDGTLTPGRRWITHPVLGCQVPDPRDVETIYDDQSLNVKTLAGIDFLHVQGYGTAGLVTNGLNWIALSNDALTETNASTVLSSEIIANGLQRAQGAVVHTGGASTTTIAHTFTATGAQSCQKAALFALAAVGAMNHVLAFTQRTLQLNDTILITFTITLS
jgi:hypothetical protein